MVHYVTQTPYKVFIRSLHRYNTHVGHVLLNSHQVSRSFSSELRPQGPALPLDGWVFVLQLRLCLIRREVRADNRLAGCITEWLIIALLLLHLITFFKIRLLVQSHRWANWGESKSEASTNHRGAVGTIGHHCPAEAQWIPLKYIYYWYVGSVQPCTSTTLRSHQKLKKLFFPLKSQSISRLLSMKEINEVAERSEHLRLIMNLAVRHDTCSALLSIPPGRHCQQEHLISHTVSRHSWGQTRGTWSHFYLHYWHCLTCLCFCSIAIGNRDGLPPNKAALCPACRAQLSVNSLMSLVTDRWQQMWI